MAGYRFLHRCMHSVPLSPSWKQKEWRIIQQIAIANVFIISLIHSLNFYIEHKLQQPTVADPTPQTKIWTTFTYYSPLIQTISNLFNPLNPKLNPICYLLALLGAHHFLHVSRITVRLLTLRRLMSYIYGAPILDVSRSHTTTQHSR